MSNPIYFVSGLIGNKFIKRTIITTPGPSSYSLNANTKLIYVQAYGGGGAGGGATVNPASPPLSTNMTDKGFAVGSGGGAGGYVELWLPVTGGSINYTVGAGGMGTSLYGENGENTTFGSYIVAEGGLGGTTFISELKTNGSINIPPTMDDPNFRQLIVGGGSGGSGMIFGADPSVDTGIIFDGGDGVAGIAGYSDAFKVLSITSGNGGMASRSTTKNINLIGKFDVSSTIIPGTSNSITLNAHGYGNGGSGAFAVCNGALQTDNGGNGANGSLIITEYSN